MVGKIFSKKIVGPKKILIQKKVFKNLVQNNLGFEKNGVSETILGMKEIWVRNFFGSYKISGLKTLGPNKVLCLEKVLSKNILVHKN